MATSLLLACLLSTIGGLCCCAHALYPRGLSYIQRFRSRGAEGHTLLREDEVIAARIGRTFSQTITL